MSTPGQMTVRNSGRNSSRQLTAAQRQAEAMKLRLGGASFEKIAEVLGYANRDGAWRAVERGRLKIQREVAGQLRDLENDRLDALQMSLWRDAMGGTTADPVKPAEKAAAARAIVRIMERRARMNGLDATDEDAAKLAAEQVAFMESLVRSIMVGVQAMLVAHGLDEHVSTLMPVLEGEVVPRALTELTAAAS